VWLSSSHARSAAPSATINSSSSVPATTAGTATRCCDLSV
jgi:hypothetical protein